MSCVSKGLGTLQGIVLHRFGWQQILLGLSGLVVVFGCGSQGDLVPVSGQILWDGKPLEGATVFFMPTGRGTMGSALTDASGRFTVKTGLRKGIRPGEYVVVVQKTEQPPDPYEYPRLITPPKYADTRTSPFRYTAPGGPANFELSSQ